MDLEVDVKEVIAAAVAEQTRRTHELLLLRRLEQLVRSVPHPSKIGIGPDYWGPLSLIIEELDDLRRSA